MIEFETETKKVEKHYTRISGIEVDTDLLIEFLEKIEDTNAMFPLTWERKYKHVAEALIEEGIVNSTNSGSWYTTKEPEYITSLRESVIEQYREDFGMDN